MKLHALLALTTLLGPLNAATLDDLLARLQTRRQAVDFRASGRLIRAPESGPRLSWQISIKGRTTGDTLRLLCEVTAPAKARVRLLLESRPAGRATIRVGHPGEAAPKELPFAQWGEPLLESDFSYEDLLEGEFLWKTQTLVREEPWGARQCYVVKSEPGPADRSHYSSVTSWIDRQTYFPVRVLKVARGGETKEFIAYGLREFKGHWSASQIEAKTRGRGGSSFLTINRGAEKAAISAKEFDPAALVRP